MAAKKAARRVTKRPMKKSAVRSKAKPRATPKTRISSGPTSVIMVGTMKGAFFYWSDAKRKTWRREGPHFPGEMVYSLAFDGRGGRKRILAGTKSWHWGAVIRTSDDLGKTWSNPERQNVKFPEGSGVSLMNIWQIVPGPDSDPDLLWAGVEPHCLFESRDRGDSWKPVEAFLTHEHRPKWTPGNGGMCMHTIVPDAQNAKRMGVAMSTGGFYRTDDGGKTWRARNVGVRAEFLPEDMRYPEFGQCVHKVVSHPSNPGRLFLQNHWGLYRSDDWGDNWKDIAGGKKEVPSDFGFSMAMHPHDPNTVYIVPLESDGFRCTPEAKMRVYRTRNGGKNWEPLTKGLPQKDAYETVLRDCLDTDTARPAGVYVGTRSGKLFASANEGNSWNEVADGLPPIVCVKAAVVA
jgi:photosystem II stability/assembly factor-like uncharacterized protein